MATRLNKRTATQSRDAIKTTQLIKRVQKHAHGEVEMTATQLRAAEILLNKTLPNLKQSDDSLVVDGEIDLIAVTFPDGSESD